MLFNAHVTRLDLDGADRLAAVTITNFAGRSERLPVTTLVLAPGGLEASRTLLLNDHQKPGGLGNHSGWLGRAFMEHPAVDAGAIRTDDERAFQSRFATHYHRLRKYSVRLSASAAWQREHRLLNASAGFIFSYPDAAADPFHRLKHLLRRTAAAPVASARPGAALQGLAALLTDRFLYKPGAEARLTLMVEQEPSAASYIALGRGTDRFGLRVARVNWVISDLTWATARRFALGLQAELARLRLGRVELCAPFTGLKPDRDWSSYFGDVNHHMGGTRMSATAAGGVVNPDLQVWGVPNLYVCSCSVFPTGSHSNPTLTLLALAHRLAARLATASA